MPQFNTIVLKDKAGTDHSFVPRDITGGVATASESSGVPIGEKTLSYSVTRTASGRRKILVKLQIPVVQDAVIAGVSKPTVVRTAYAEMGFSFDSTSSTAERDDMAVLTSWLLAGVPGNNQILNAISTLSGPY